MLNSRLTRALIALLLVVSVPAAAMDSVIVAKKKSAAGCAGSPDLSGTLFWYNFNSVTCTGTPALTYTTHATEEFPASEAWTHVAAPTSVVGVTSTGSMPPDNDCVLIMDGDNAADGTEHYTMPDKNFTALNTADGASFAVRFSATETPADDRAILQVGDGGDNRLLLNAKTTDDLQCQECDAAGTCKSISTASDTSSSCCDVGGGEDCSGQMFDGVARTVECVFEVDSQEIWIDGCLAISAGQVTSNPLFDWPASATERTRMGVTANFIGLDMDIGLFALTPNIHNVTTNYHVIWSGGDGDMTDGDECWNCDDAADGSRCDD